MDRQMEQRLFDKKCAVALWRSWFFLLTRGREWFVVLTRGREWLPNDLWVRVVAQKQHVVDCTGGSLVVADDHHQIQEAHRQGRKE